MNEPVQLIALVYDNSRYEADLAVSEDTGFLRNDGGFESAVTVSLFTWKRDDSANVAEQGQKYGWWGDSFADDPGDQIGSHLWKRLRAKNSPETRRLVAKDCQSALDWMKQDGIAKSISVEVERFSTDVISAKVSIVRSDDGQWTGIWQVHLNKL